MGVSMVMGIPQDGWFIAENPQKKWMIFGTPVLGTPELRKNERYSEPATTAVLCNSGKHDHCLNLFKGGWQSF